MAVCLLYNLGLFPCQREGRKKVVQLNYKFIILWIIWHVTCCNQNNKYPTKNIFKFYIDYVTTHYRSYVYTLFVPPTKNLFIFRAILCIYILSIYNKYIYNIFLCN